MSRIKCWLLVLFVCCFSVSAYAEPGSGGFGYALFGVTNVNFGNLQNVLRSTEGFGKNFTISSNGTAAGGGGHALLTNRLLIGGKGYGSITSITGSENDVEVSVTSGGGGFNLGYSLINNNKWLVYPFIGYGGGGYTLSIENHAKQGLKLGDETLAESTNAEYTAEQSIFEVGLGAHHLFFNPETSGGLMVGVILNAAFGVSKIPWRRDDKTIQALGNTKLQIITLSFTFGGGGFSPTESKTEKHLDKPTEEKHTEELPPKDS